MDELIVVAFRKAEGAEQLLADLERSAAAGAESWSPLETAIVTRDRLGTFRIRDRVDLGRARGRRSRAAWRLLVAAIAAGPLGGTLWGADAATLWNRLLTAGLDERFMTMVPSALYPGGSALFLLVDQPVAAPSHEMLSTSVGRVYHTATSDEVDRVLDAALTSTMMTQVSYD